MHDGELFLRTILGVAAIWLDELKPERRVWFGRGLPGGRFA
jgi:hypothetical protein